MQGGSAPSSSGGGEAGPCPPDRFLAPAVLPQQPDQGSRYVDPAATMPALGVLDQEDTLPFQEGFIDRDKAPLEVDPVPAEGADLAQPQAGGKVGIVEDVIQAVPDGGKEGRDVPGSQGEYLPVPHPGRLNCYCTAWLIPVSM